MREVERRSEFRLQPVRLESRLQAVQAQRSALAIAAVCALLSSSFAQEDAELPPPPKRPGVQITFLPPPLDGTLSLGIFTKAGKLVRTLHREARTKDFVVGLNGLITWWDGKNDAGAVAPAGKYFARGFAVGAVEFQGEAFHFNDWVGEDGTPRIRRIHSISPFFGGPSTYMGLEVTLADGKRGNVQIFPDGKTAAFAPNDPSVAPTKGEPGNTDANVKIVCKLGDRSYGLQAGKLVILESDGWKPVGISPVENAIDGVAMPEGDGLGWWIIDRVANGSEIKRFAPDGSFVRRLFIPADQPQPFGLCVGSYDLSLIILEEKDGLQRVRKLERKPAAEPEVSDPDSPIVSEWAVTFSKSIRACDDLAAIQSELKTESGAPFTATEKINVRLLPNQLMRNASMSTDVGVAVDAKGSFLRTADGLPLKRITETPGLRWIAMMREPEGKGVTIFQSDGAVVEEFKARKLANMMAFDAGDYDWAGK